MTDLNRPQLPRVDDAPADPQPEPTLVGFPPPVAPSAGYGYGYGYGYGNQDGPVPGTFPVAPRPEAAGRRLDALPDQPREYHQLLRGPRHAWWRPLAALGLAAVMIAAWSIAAVVVTALIGRLAGQPDIIAEITDLASFGPIGFFYVNLSIIGFIPATVFAIWLAHGVRPRFVSSVLGGIRWRWLARCALILVPVWVLYLGLEVLTTDPASPRPAEWPILLAIVLVMTPFQAAGEEYLCRGLLAQSLGSWFRSPLAGLLVTAPVSAAVFALLHLSLDPWVFATLMVFALTASVATWRTGGLEAAIAIHTVNNVGAFFLVLTLGGWSEAFISEGTTGTPLMVLISLVVHVLALALILWQARRAKIDRWYRPRSVPVDSVPLPAAYAAVRPQ